MMNVTEPDPAVEAEILIEKFLSRDIAEDEGERLLAFLREHPDWEREIYDQQHIVNLLKEVRSLEASEGDRSGDAFKSELMGELLNFYEKVSVYSRNMRRRRLRQRLAMGGMTALCFFLLVLVVHAFWSGSLTTDYVSRIMVSHPAPPTSEAVAVLSKAVDVRWTGDSTLRAEPGAVLSPCTLAFDEGLVLIQFYNGVRLVVEGPACLHLRSVDEVECDHGRFSVELPTPHTGFTLRSPAFGNVVGEKYFIRLDEKTAELHCFRGDLSSIPNVGDDERKSRELREGEGFRLNENAVLESIPSEPDRFVSIDTIEKRAKERADDQFRVWRQSRQALVDDPALVLYFDFQRDGFPRSDRILNRAGRSTEPREGILVGGVRGTGRWPDKDSLEFRVGSDRLLVSIPSRPKSVSMSVSLRADDIGRNLNSIFLTERFQDGPLHWQILNAIEGGEKGAIRLGIKDPNPRIFKATNFDSPVVFDEARMGVWTRLAVVIDAEKKSITHYRNGEVLSRHELPFEIEFGLDRAEIGNWTSDTAINPIRNFIGGFEEFLLFSRALSDDEIERLHLSR